MSVRPALVAAAHFGDIRMRGCKRRSNQIARHKRRATSLKDVRYAKWPHQCTILRSKLKKALSYIIILLSLTLQSCWPQKKSQKCRAADLMYECANLNPLSSPEKAQEMNNRIAAFLDSRGIQAGSPGYQEHMHSLAMACVAAPELKQEAKKRGQTFSDYLDQEICSKAR